MTTPEASTRHLVEQYIDRYNEHDIEGLLDLFAPEVEQGGNRHDRDAIEGAFQTWVTAFPDIQMHPEQLLVDGTDAALHFSFTGTHAGSFLGIEATNEYVEVEEVLLFRASDGVFTRFDAVWDELGMFVQIGAIDHPLG